MPQMLKTHKLFNRYKINITYFIKFININLFENNKIY